MFHLQQHQRIGHHVFGEAIYEVYFTFFNNPPDKTKTYVNMFGVHMILIVLQQGNCRLIIREKGSRVMEGPEELANQGTQSQSFLVA
jgi:hypothetical protein